ncbi:apoptosis inhibitor 5-like [Rhopilema esculentum]|uniref:apoptosis inhibitor 5-like n=1 Tax=Rhopilema esculentum TaxID=499914 RepID=UPI0031DCB576|eukprot:gene11617-21855_t
MAGVEELYKSFGVLADAGDKISEHEDAYKAIIDGVKGDAPQKKLACQFIPRFFKDFPKLAEQAIDAQLDLCEDEDAVIRRQAMRTLPDFCKDDADHVTRIADILTQLLQTEDEVELAIVKSGLVSLIKKNPKGALGGIFSQIVSEDDVVREKAIKFLNYSVQLLLKEVFHPNPDMEMFLFEEIKKTMSDVTGDEFKSFMAVVSKLKSIVSQPQNLADVIAEQAELEKSFEPSDIDSIDRLITCTRQAVPFFKKGASSEKFYDYLVKNVLPVINEVAQTGEMGDFRLELLKLFVEVSPYVTEDQAKESIDIIFNKLIDYMPAPPTDEEEDKEAADDKEIEAEKKLNFSYVECLLFTFHQLGRQDEEYLSKEEAAEKLKDFRSRLQYFARQLQAYIKQLRVALQGKTGAELEEAENKIKCLALKTTNNINALIRDLFHNPPSYKSVIIPSWKAPNPSIPETVDERRKRAGITPVTFEGSPTTKKKNSSEVYTPPSRRNGSATKSPNWSGGYGQSNYRRGFGRQRRGRGRGRGSRGGGYSGFLYR